MNDEYSAITALWYCVTRNLTLQ